MRTQGSACRSLLSLSSSRGSLRRASGRSALDLQNLSGSRPTCRRLRPHASFTTLQTFLHPLNLLLLEWQPGHHAP